MSCKPADFFELVGALGGGEPKETKEIRDRTAISRAYYGAFHTALSYATQNKAPPSRLAKGGAHEHLFDRLEQVADKLPSNEARFLRAGIENLRKLKDWRTEADYRIDDDCNPARPPQAMDIAKRICAKLEASRVGASS